MRRFSRTHEVGMSSSPAALRAVHLIEDDKRLPPHGNPGLERPAAEFGLEPTHGTLRGKIEVVSLELLPGLPLDAHLGMAAANGHRVPAELNRHVVGVLQFVVI